MDGSCMSITTKYRNLTCQPSCPASLTHVGISWTRHSFLYINISLVPIYSIWMNSSADSITYSSFFASLRRLRNRTNIIDTLRAKQLACHSYTTTTKSPPAPSLWLFVLSTILRCSLLSSSWTILVVWYPQHLSIGGVCQPTHIYHITYWGT